MKATSDERVVFHLQPPNGKIYLIYSPFKLYELKENGLMFVTFTLRVLAGNLYEINLGGP
jgi:hypothetical protein